MVDGASDLRPVLSQTDRVSSDMVLSNAAPVALSEVNLLTVAVLVVFGSVLLFGAGFAHADLMHNAAHDSRHAFTFPCH